MISSKLLFLGVFCVFLVVCSANAPRSSKIFADETANRIVNGQNATRGQFPYQVSLRLVNGNHFCSGAILNNRWVITTGVCMVGRSPPIILVFAAVHLRSGPDGMPYIVDRIKMHNQFNPARWINDVALIRTAHPFIFIIPLIRAIALPRTDTTAAGVPLTVSGWGYVRVIF